MTEPDKLQHSFPLPLDVLGEIIQYLPVKSIAKLSLLCGALPSKVVWSQVSVIDYSLGGNDGSDWVDAVPHLASSGAKIVKFLWRHSEDTTVLGEQHVDHMMLETVSLACIDRFSSLMKNVRFFSVGRAHSGIYHFLHHVIQFLDPNILEELSFDTEMVPDVLEPFFRNGAPWPRLKVVRAELGRKNIVPLLEAITESLSCVRTLRLCGLPFHSERPDLKPISRFIARYSSTLEHLDLSQMICEAARMFSDIDTTPSRWKELPALLAAEIPLSSAKITIDGLSLWGGVILKNRHRGWLPECESFFHIVHKSMTTDALKSLAAVMSAGIDLNEEGIEFFLSQLHRWSEYFKKVPIEFRPKMHGWSWFRDCLGHLYHIAGTMWSREIRQILVTCPSILETISLRNASRRLWSSSALTNIIRDTEWWLKTKSNFNATEGKVERGPHPIVYLARDGEAVLQAAKSPLLSWEESDLYQNHFFIDLLQLAPRCRSNVDSYDQALKIMYNKVVELNLRPIKEPLTTLQLGALSKIAPIKSCLPQLASRCHVLLHSSLLFKPGEFVAALTAVAGQDNLPREILLAAAAAYWRRVTENYETAVFGHVQEHEHKLNAHLIDLVANFGVVPEFVFWFLKRDRRVSPAAKIVVEQIINVLEVYNVPTKCEGNYWIS